MKRTDANISLASIVLAAGVGLSSCSIGRTYSVVSDQMAPVKADAVEIESSEGLAHSLPVPGSMESEAAVQAPTPGSAPSAASLSQNAPLPTPPAAAAPEATPGLRQNAPTLPARKEAKPAAASARQNAPELKAKPEPKAKPMPEPKAKPAAASARQNAPELKPKPEPKAKPKPEPKTKPEAKAKPATASARQNAPELKAKPEPKAKTKPEPKAKPTPRTQQQVVVTLKKGDSLENIARAHGVSLQALYRENGINATTRLRSGMQIRIPKRSLFRRLLRLPWGTPRSAAPAPTSGAATTTSKRSSSNKKSTSSKPKMRIYTMKPGDTISEVAEKFDVSTSAIIKANDLSSSDLHRIRDGRKLRIPASR